MSVLPEVSELRAIRYEYFPTVWQNVIWRNWGYVPIERLAKILDASCEELKRAAELMGLDPEETVKEIWEKRGYITLIRNNWHLCTYEQLLVLLNMTEETLAFILKEDDFLWVKLGFIKPLVEAPKYAPLTKEQEAQTRQIAKLFQERFTAGNGVKDNGFEFIEDFYVPLKENEFADLELVSGEKLRMVYPYFALYGDTLIDENIDPFPERLLMEYAKAGINGIWMQGVLYQLVEFSFDPSLSEGWEIRLRSLRKLVEKAKRFGIGIYIYLNEPRSMPDAFFKKYPHLRGSQEGDFYAMCTSTQEVKDYLYQAVKKLFEEVPDLAGFFSISMSENLTNCHSRWETSEQMCPRCSERNAWEVVAEVNNLMAKGAHDAVPTAKTIVWTWGWEDAWAEKVVPLLTEGQILQCTSEEALKYCIGGIAGSVLDYSMSLCGPGEKSKNVWKAARKQGLQISAKVQINNTWEMSAVPYIPVFDKIEQHINQLKEQGVQHLQASWTLGGCPSPNLRLAAWLIEEKGTAKEFLIDWLGNEIGMGVYEAQKKLSNAFSNFPFHIHSIYVGPQNSGPMCPFFLKKSGYWATMVGYPYDDLEAWRSIYPKEIYEEQFRKMCIQWRAGVEELLSYQGHSSDLDELIDMAQIVLCHFESSYHHIRFVNLRGEDAELADAASRREMLQIVREEMDTVQTVIELRVKDSRVGYEASNHYYYTLQDLREKMINLAYCEKKLGGIDYEKNL